MSRNVDLPTRTISKKPTVVAVSIASIIAPENIASVTTIRVSIFSDYVT